jgi:hypothetical protein
MKHYIWTYSEGRPPRDGSGIVKTVRIWRIKNNRPVFIVERKATFESPFQMVMEAMQTLKGELPRKCFARNHFGGMAYGNAWGLQNDGIATFTQI